jgi:peptidoglycan/xylan/chitin deacetylase (PgdA/CDA1 family)
MIQFIVWLLRKPLHALMVIVIAVVVVGILARSVFAAPPIPDGAPRRVRVPVLMYHYISVPPNGSDKYRLDLSVTPRNFRKQMEWLRDNGYTPIRPEQYVGALLWGERLPDRPILLTFDDGYEDAYTAAFPILREFGFTGTFFVVTDWIDSGRTGYLSWAQVKEMAAFGMAIHSHSREHQDMRGRDRDWHIYHVGGTFDTLRYHVGPQVKIFCYPAGQFDQAAIEALRVMGVVAAFTTRDGTYGTVGEGMLQLPRVRIRGSHTLADFAYLIQWDR